MAHFLKKKTIRFLSIIVAYFFRAKEFFTTLIRDNSTDLWHFWTVGFGTEEELKDYCYKINFFNDDDAEDLQYRGRAISIDKNFDDIIMHDDGLVLKDAAFQRLCNNEQLCYDFTIYEI